MSAVPYLAFDFKEMAEVRFLDVVRGVIQCMGDDLDIKKEIVAPPFSTI
ncbi:MAG: hypothetical protein OEZ29_01595 [Candidatus Bathyarchaeota archaeon]|nr:hypothetical protein [Candidatus Bathyarchaeota archaeon]MDH5779270.1 hypothetical protein [Candidatus Bathyarchaeota archaeon]